MALGAPLAAQAPVRAGAEGAAPPPPAPRPRGALVLGGGGAKGGAHIGVLRELERLRVPVDLIAGTSIGAVIGGLYASGMDVDELEALVHSLEWSDLLSDRAPRPLRPFRRKAADERIPSRLELGFNGGRIRFPRGLVSGQNVELTLRSATLPVANVRSFEQLPIPFRAVATDLETGEAAVLGQGELSTAIRASMSIPGAFAPVERDGRLLVDGGLVDNLPVDVARAMGADVVIAVDLTPPLYEADEITSALEVSAQTLRITTLRNTLPSRRALVEGRDLLLQPDVESIAITDFRQLPASIAAGRAAAREREPFLRGLSLDSASYARLRASQQRRGVALPPLDFVRVRGARGTDPDLVAARVRLPLGREVSAAELDQA
ncbi:MAG: hypothetical protein D6701_00390, partial [Gemmatimonadetes bacterium]